MNHIVSRLCRVQWPAATLTLPKSAILSLSHTTRIHVIELTLQGNLTKKLRLCFSALGVEIVRELQKLRQNGRYIFVGVAEKKRIWLSYIFRPSLRCFPGRSARLQTIYQVK